MALGLCLIRCSLRKIELWTVAIRRSPSQSSNVTLQLFGLTVSSNLISENRPLHKINECLHLIEKEHKNVLSKRLSFRIIPKLCPQKPYCHAKPHVDHPQIQATLTFLVILDQ